MLILNISLNKKQSQKGNAKVAARRSTARSSPSGFWQKNLPFSRCFKEYFSAKKPCIALCFAVLIAFLFSFFCFSFFQGKC